MVNQIIDAAWTSQERRGWVDVEPIAGEPQPA
jgi:hypothetical protein